MHTTPKGRRVAVGTMVLGAALATAGWFAPAASADHVDPTPVTGDANLKCVEADASYTGEHKIPSQPDSNSTHTFGDVEIFITNVEVVNGHAQFDWSATTADGDDDGEARDEFFYDAVLVKAGGGGTESSGNLYTYDPEVSTDTNLESPKDSISHISFCFDAASGGTDGTTDDTTDGTTDDATTTDGSTDSVLGTAGVADPDPEPDGTEVKGNVVLPEQLPRTGDNDRSMTIIGVALLCVGGGIMLVRRNLVPGS